MKGNNLLILHHYIRTLGLYCIALALVAITPLIAEETSSQSPEFSVASIRVSKTGLPGGNLHFYHSGRLTASDESLVQLLALGYGIPTAKIMGGPAWISKTLFDIDAVTDSDTSSRMMQMSKSDLVHAQQELIKNLLKTRFHLSVSYDNKLLPHEALIKAGDSVKLATSDKLTSSVESGLHYINIEGPEAMQELSDVLTHVEHTLVTNDTGEHRSSVIKLSWNGLSSSDPEQFGTINTTSELPTLPEALKDQLGLKLVRTRGPVQVLEILQVSLPQEQ